MELAVRLVGALPSKIGAGLVPRYSVAAVRQCAVQTVPSIKERVGGAVVTPSALRLVQAFEVFTFAEEDGYRRLKQPSVQLNHDSVAVHLASQSNTLDQWGHGTALEAAQSCQEILLVVA